MRVSLKYWNVKLGFIEESIGALVKRDNCEKASGRFSDIADASSLSLSSYHDSFDRSPLFFTKIGYVGFALVHYYTDIGYLNGKLCYGYRSAINTDGSHFACFIRDESPVRPKQD